MKFKWTGHVQIAIFKTAPMPKAVYQTHAAVFLYFPDLGPMDGLHALDGVRRVMEGNTIQHVWNFQPVENGLEALEFSFGRVRPIAANS